MSCFLFLTDVSINLPPLVYNVIVIKGFVPWTGGTTVYNHLPPLPSVLSIQRKPRTTLLHSARKEKENLPGYRSAVRVQKCISALSDNPVTQQLGDLAPSNRGSSNVSLQRHQRLSSSSSSSSFGEDKEQQRSNLVRLNKTVRLAFRDVLISRAFLFV